MKRVSRGSQEKRKKGGAAFNYPLSGTMVPDLYHKQNPLVLSLMIEVRRSLYMNELSGERWRGFSDFYGGELHTKCEERKTSREQVQAISILVERPMARSTLNIRGDHHFKYS